MNVQRSYAKVSTLLSAMVKIPSSVRDSVERFLNALRQRYYVEAAYLYGSQVKGTADSWSDIDVAVVSPDFSDDLFEQRVALMQLAARIDDRIEPFPFTAETFNASDPLASEIQQHGLRVA